jgi:hypothetical protein
MKGGGMLSLQEIHILDICIIESTRGTFGNYALSAAEHFLAILLLAGRMSLTPLPGVLSLSLHS